MAEEILRTKTKGREVIRMRAQRREIQAYRKGVCCCKKGNTLRKHYEIFSMRMSVDKSVNNFLENGLFLTYNTV